MVAAVAVAVAVAVGWGRCASHHGARAGRV